MADMDADGNARSAIAVAIGSCVLLECEIIGSSGAGVIVGKPGSLETPDSPFSHLDEILSERGLMSDKISGMINKFSGILNSEPFLYMKTSTIRNCGFSGVEAREQGSVLLERCNISDNNFGVHGMSGLRLPFAKYLPSRNGGCIQIYRQSEIR